MSTKNDAAWERYIKAKAITFAQPTYIIDADELKSITNREPRLLTKFDTPEQLPKPLKTVGFTLLPIRNGQYQLVRGNLFVELAACVELTDFVPNLPFPLTTIGRGSGEMQYIDLAFNTGLLHHFLSIGQLFQTIRGREYTRQFTFQFFGQSISVDSVQIEVDAGYESLYDVVLIEAKIGIPSHFNIRQLYYPYRHFSILVPHKRIRNVFLAYDIPSASFSLHEFSFEDLQDPWTIHRTQCKVYRLAPSIPLTIYDLIDARFQTSNALVPQADDLNKVYELLTLVAAGLNRADDLADYFVFDIRQSNYYREAAEYLGLITISRQDGYRLTNLGVTLLSAPAIDQPRMLAKVVVNSWIFVELIRRSQANQQFTNDDIEDVISSVKTDQGTVRYSKTTVPRRRRTIVAWIRWLAKEIGCFTVSPTGYALR